MRESVETFVSDETRDRQNCGRTGRGWALSLERCRPARKVLVLNFRLVARNDLLICNRGQQYSSASGANLIRKQVRKHTASDPRKKRLSGSVELA